MALVRILVDGYSLLHHWSELAPDKPRHSECARDELVRILQLYSDATGTPVTVFFDGSGKAVRGPKEQAARGVEVLFSRAGQTADQMIERAAHRFSAYGEVLAVTNDRAERETVINLGGIAAECGNFIAELRDVLKDLAAEIRTHNRREQFGYRRRPSSNVK